MKKLGLIAISLVAMVATLGVGFSMWSQTVTVNGSVNTGKVSVALDHQYSNDDLPEINGDVYSGTLDPNTAGNWNQNSDGSWSWTGSNFGKNVAEIICQQNEPADNAMTITVNNGYPGYEGEIMVGVTNTGTVPVGIYNGFTLTASNVATIVNPVLDGVTYFIEPVNNSIVAFESSNQFQEKPDNNTIYTVTVTRVPSTSLTQIEPGLTNWFIVDVNVMEASAQNASYTFTLTAMFSQWNEIP